MTRFYFITTNGKINVHTYGMYRVADDASRYIPTLQGLLLFGGFVF